MSEFALLSLRDVAPLGIPISLPPPPAPSGGSNFDQHLAQATQRKEAEVEPREKSTRREPEGEYRRLELPRREDRVREPVRELRPVEDKSPHAEPPADPTAQSAPVAPTQDAEVATPDVVLQEPEDALVLPETPVAIEDAPEDAGTGAVVDTRPETSLIPLPSANDPWQQPTLDELFPEYFTGLSTKAPLAATDAPLPLDGAQLPVTAAGAPLGLAVPTIEQPGSTNPETPTLTPRERRYGFGLGKPFQGHAAVNRRHLDRFGRDIPLPTTFVATRNINTNSYQAPMPPSTLADQPAIQPSASVDDAVPAAIPIPPAGFGKEAVAPELPVTDDDTPTFGSQVAYKPQAAHLRATTPGFGEQSHGDQTFGSEQQPQAGGASSSAGVVAQSDEATSQEFGNLWRNAMAPPSTEADPLITLSDAMPQKEATTGPLPLNGISATITRGTGDPSGKGEAVPARETIAFRSIATELTAKLSKEAVPEGATRLRVTLRPRELGTITIELIRHGDQLETRITTRTKDALALFEKMMPELKVQLEERGFNVRSLDLTHQQPLGRDDQGHASRDWTRPNHGWEKPPLPRPLLEIPESETGELDLRDIADGLNLTV